MKKIFTTLLMICAIVLVAFSSAKIKNVQKKNIYKVTINTFSGCTPTASTFSQAACDSFYWTAKNKWYYASNNTDTLMLINAEGCDSVVTLDLTINNSIFVTTPMVACDSFTWMGKTYYTSGTYADTTILPTGCLNVINLMLTINNASTSTTNASVCSSELPFVWNGENYTTNGTYYDTVTNAQGCDSIMVLNLTVNTGTFNTTTQSACGSYVWNGRTYTASTTDTFSYVNSNGCVSVDTLYLTINNGTYNVTTQTACDSLWWNGTKYTASGMYVFNYNNPNGCASADTLNLTINNSSTSTTILSSCDSLWWNGVKYTATGIYVYHTPNAVGCDSAATLNLTINNSSSSTFTASACGSYTWALNSKVYTSSNHTDTVHLINAAGCDSLITLDLTILANITDVHINGIGAFCGDTAITQLSTNINSTYGSVAYEWIRLGYNEDTWQIISHDSVVAVSTVYPAQYVVKTTIAGCGTFWSNQEGVLPVTKPNLSLLPTPAVEVCNKNVVMFTASSTDVDFNNYAFYNGTTLMQNDTAKLYTTPMLTTVNSGTIYTVEATNKKPVFDGNIVENFWGKPLAVSTFGPSSSFGAGHELNAIYSRADNNNLYFAIAGNVQDNNRIVMFIDSKTGGYNNANYGRNNIGNQAIKNLNSGIIFDPGFEADYAIGIGTDNTNSQYYFDLFTLSGTASNASSGGPNVYIGSNLSPTSGYNIGANPINNSQTKGFEFSIPKAAIGYTGGSVRVFVLYSADNGFISNQFLTRANTGAGNYGNGAVNFALATPSPIVIPVHTMNAACKSMLSTIVTVKPNFTSTKYDTVCSNMLPYAWANKNYTTSGSYNDTAMGSNGCDSIATLHLFIKDTSVSATAITVCNNMLPYSWNGVDYNTAGTYTWKGTNVAGCDSIATLMLSISDTTTSSTTTTSCDSLKWGGITYYTSGVYTWKGTNAAGCDSIATLNLAINNAPPKPTIIVFTNALVPPALGVVYTCAFIANTVTHTWSYTGTGATINNNGDTAITVDFAANATSGYIQVNAVAGNGCTSLNDTVFVNTNLLPVVLKLFAVEKRDNDAMVKWTTASEVNSKNFEVQRSLDGRTFATIGTVEAKGFASEYLFVDTKLPTNSGVVYYRLKQADNNGKFEYSAIKQINVTEKQEVLNLYPNPARTVVSLLIDKLIGNGEIIITDLYGKQMKTQPLSMGTNTIDVSKLSKGMYFVSVITSEGKTTKKLVIND